MRTTYKMATIVACTVLSSFLVPLFRGSPVVRATAFNVSTDANKPIPLHHDAVPYLHSGSMHPIPTELVLNQTNEQGVPMVATPNANWPTIVSQAAVVMDLSTGTIVYAKNPLVQHFPASITKILTAMIALERGNLNDKLVASQNAVNQPPDKLYMKPGEVYPLRNLLYALLLDSANDAAVDIAEHYGGSVAGFANIMNQTARQVGAMHSHFDNPNGLPDPNHVTTAYDMAEITRAAMQIPEFRTIVQTKMYHWVGDEWQSDLWNLNRMLFYYPGAIGVKTGYTSVAHETLVVAATRGSQTFLAVLMDNPTDYSIRQDGEQLLNFAFAHFQPETILSSGTVVKSLKDPEGHPVQIVTDYPVMATVARGTQMKLQQHLVLHMPKQTAVMGTIVGDLTWYENGRLVGQVPVSITRAWQVPVHILSLQTPSWKIGGGAVCGLGIAGTLVLWRGIRKRKRRAGGGPVSFTHGPQ